MAGAESKAQVTIGVAGARQNVIAEFLGKDFEVQRYTKPLEAEVAIASAKVEASEGGTELVTAVGELIDIYLKPHGGHRTKASKLLLDRWESGEGDIGEIRAYAENIQELVVAPPRLAR